MKISFHNRGETHNFWQNYTDLMSGLMIIFLIASLGYLVSKDKGRKIDAIYEAQKELGEKSKYFMYNEKYQRLECCIGQNDPVFDAITKYPHNPRKFEICSTIKDKYRTSLINAGKELRKFINSQRRKYKDNGIDYEILIDGRVSANSTTSDNLRLSYMRARSVYNIWNRNGLFNDKIDNIHCAGSGAGGVGRYQNEKDRTIIIHIIPYVKNTK